METFIGVMVAAAVVTKLVDLTRNAFDKGGSAPKWLWNVEAFGLGIIGAFLFNIEPVTIPDAFRFEVSGPALQVATGLAVGAFSSGVHELFDFLSSAGKRIRRP